MLYDNVRLEVSTQIVDPDLSFRMRQLWTLWCHEYDVIESHDVIDYVTNRRPVGTSL